jgi:hypothetical protein
MDKRLKNSFSIKPINIDKIEQKYNLSIQSNIQHHPPVEPLKNATKISELSVSLDPEVVNYLDEAKKQRKCIPTMFCHFNNEVLGESTNVSCFWCRHTFDTIPIGCPLRYVSSQIEKKYTSEITRDKYRIKENIDADSMDPENYKNSDKIQYLLHQKGYYESDGVFCSFNCCLAFIQDNKSDPVYRNSKNLLFKIYHDIFDLSPTNLTKAPSWRLLAAYGGHLTLADYRKSFNKVQYIEHGRMVSTPKFAPVGFLYEEKNRF